MENAAMKKQVYLLYSLTIISTIVPGSLSCDGNSSEAVKEKPGFIALANSCKSYPKDNSEADLPPINLSWERPINLPFTAQEFINEFLSKAAYEDDMLRMLQTEQQKAEQIISYINLTAKLPEDYESLNLTWDHDNPSSFANKISLLRYIIHRLDLTKNKTLDQATKMPAHVMLMESLRGTEMFLDPSTPTTAPFTVDNVAYYATDRLHPYVANTIISPKGRQFTQSVLYAFANTGFPPGGTHNCMNTFWNREFPGSKDNLQRLVMYVADNMKSEERSFLSSETLSQDDNSN